MTDDVSKLKQEILTLRKDRDAWASLASRQSALLLKVMAEVVMLREIHKVVDKLHREKFGEPALKDGDKRGWPSFGEDWPARS